MKVHSILCCQGLKEDEIYKLQDLILIGTILLKKAKDIKIMGMEDVATRLKHDRILQDAIVQFMCLIHG